MFSDLRRSTKRYAGHVDSNSKVVGTNYPLFNIENSFSTAFGLYGASSSAAVTASILKAPKTGSINKLGYSLSTVIGTSPEYIIKLETVTRATATRKFPTPSGTLWAANTSKKFTPTGSNKFVWLTLTSSASVTLGDTIGVVIRYSTGTISGSAYAEFRWCAYTHTAPYRGLPLPIYYELFVAQE